MRAKKRHTSPLSPNRLPRRYSNGGSAAAPAALDTPAPAEPTAPAKQEAPEAPDKAAEQAAGIAFTTEQVEQIKLDAVAAYQQHLQEATDFNKMTPEEQVAHLQAQIADGKLSDYTTRQLGKEELPLEAARWLKGKDEASISENIKAFKAMYDKGVQAGVEKRFKTNGYIPRGTAAGDNVPEEKARPRGVSIQ